MARPSDDEPEFRPRKKKGTKKKSSSSGINWKGIGGVLLCLLFIAGAVGKFMKGFNRARNAAAGQPAAENTGSGFWNSDADNKKLSENNLRQIALALHNYHDVFRTFPAGAVVREGDSAATNSWAISALPFLDQQTLYQRYDSNKVWNGPENQPVTNTPLAIFQIPGRDSSGAVSHYAGNSHLFVANQTFSLNQISDGATNTLLLGEVSAGLKSWADPTNVRDLARGLGATPDQFGGTFSGGSQILMADGQIKFLSEKTDPAVLKAIATPTGGEVVADF